VTELSAAAVWLPSIDRSSNRPAESHSKLQSTYHILSLTQAGQDVEEEGGWFAVNIAEDVSRHAPCPGLVLKRGSLNTFHEVYFAGVDSGSARFFSSGKWTDVIPAFTGML
jgi:hypothetical protein